MRETSGEKRSESCETRREEKDKAQRERERGGSEKEEWEIIKMAARATYSTSSSSPPPPRSPPPPPPPPPTPLFLRYSSTLFERVAPRGNRPARNIPSRCIYDSGGLSRESLSRARKPVVVNSCVLGCRCNVCSI